MAAAEHWGKADIAAKKTRSLLSYCTEHTDVKTIPNPYYVGRDVSEGLGLAQRGRVWPWRGMSRSSSWPWVVSGVPGVKCGRLGRRGSRRSGMRGFVLAGLDLRTARLQIIGRTRWWRTADFFSLYSWSRSFCIVLSATASLSAYANDIAP